MKTLHLALVEDLARAFVALDGVEAVALGGSRANAAAVLDAGSDIDLYVYTRRDLCTDSWRAVMDEAGAATRANIGLDAWGSGDEWLHAPTGIHCDIVYFDAAWMEDRLSRVLHLHEPSLGYSTCFWHTIRVSVSLEDPRGWFTVLQARAAADYPEPLRLAIIGKKHPLLRGVLPAWANQIAKTASRPAAAIS